MKIAFAGKGGVGKTTLCAWTADKLARMGHNVWMIDADTALSLGAASGLEAGSLPVPLVEREDLVRERIGEGVLHLTPDVSDLPEALAVDVPLCGDSVPGPAAGDGPGRKRLLVMGTVAGAGGGCACSANALLKAVLAHLVMAPATQNRQDWVLVDLEAGVEHLGRGTAMHVDALVVVSEPSMRGLTVAAEIGTLAQSLGISRQILALNRHDGSGQLPDLKGLPPLGAVIPPLNGLLERQLSSASVLNLPETEQVDKLVGAVLAALV